MKGGGKERWVGERCNYDEDSGTLRNLLCGTIWRQPVITQWTGHGCLVMTK